jgi:ABC-type amino acid transport substrate-binding protein
VDVVVPTSFTFPSAGKLLTLSYLFFAGWLSGYAITVSQYPAFLATGMAAFFGNTMVAVPFLLDLFRIPADMFPLFVIVDNIVGNRFGAVLAAMHTLVLVLLSASAIAGMLRLRAIALLRYLAITLLLTLAAVGGVRLLFETFSRPYQGYAQLISMRPLYPTAAVKVLDVPPDPLPGDARRDASTLDRILERGVLRVGYASDALPFAFRNAEGELVGFDIEMAHTLALELGVDLELVRIEGADLARLLDAGYLDTAMTGVQLTTERMAEMSFSTPYLEEALGFLVPDHRREEFSSRKSLQRMESPRIGVLDVPYHIAMLRLYLPQAEIVVLQSPREFLRGGKELLDAMLFPAESAGAWSLVYPSFTVAIPQPDVVSAPLAYPVARGDLQMAGFLSNWVELKKKDGTIESLHEHWILGGAARQRGPRWSVIRDVLGWVE